MEQRRFWIACALLWVCGAATRLAILAVPPVITAIQSDLGMSGTQIGVLSGLPVILFALFAIPGSLLIARLGVATALTVGLLVTAAGTALRSAMPTVAILYAGTVVMGAGIAMLHVALPAAVRQWTPARIGFATALYTNGLLAGEIVPVAMSGPVLMPLFESSWRMSLAVWAAPVAVFAILVMALAPRGAEAGGRPATHWWPDWSDPTLWRAGFTFASITATYFASNAFLPAHLTAAGRPELIAPGLTALNAGQIPASFILLAVAHRFVGRARPIMAIGAAAIVCVLGLALTASYLTVAFCGAMGFVLAAALTCGLTIPAFVAEPEDMARTTAGMFTISYLTSVAISILSGAAWDATGMTTAAFLVIALGASPMIWLSPTIPFRRSA